MQKFIRSNPFFIPLFGLFIGYVWNRWGLFNPIFLICGFRSFPVSVLVLLLGAFLFVWMIRPKYRKANPTLRMISLFCLHLGLALWLFHGVKSLNKFPWEGGGTRGWALVEVRDSLLPLKKSGGMVYCVGWKDFRGVNREANFALRCVFDSGDTIRSSQLPRALRKYWVPTDCIFSYAESEVPFDPNWRRIMRTLGIHGYMKWDPSAVVLVSDPIEDGFSLLNWSKNHLLSWIRSAVFTHLSTEGAGLTYAMLIGDKSGLDLEIERQFGLGGLLHVLAVSGMHVSLIMGALLWLLTGFGYRGRPTIKTLFLLLAAGWFYAFLSGSSASVIRAMIGASWVWLGKFAVHRKQKLTHVLCGSAYLQWISDPFIVEQLGFQLSYLAVLGIATLHTRWIHLYEHPNTFINSIISSLSLTLSATLFTMPLILFQFGSFPTWFLLGNLFLLPLFSLMVYLSLICLMLVSIPFLSDGLFAFLDAFIHWVLHLLALLEKLPLPQLNTLNLGVLSFLCLMLIVFLVDAYFAVLLKLNDKPVQDNQSKKVRALLPIFIGLMAFFVVHELELCDRRNRDETFKISHFQRNFIIEKKGNQLLVWGDRALPKTRKRIRDRLKNYIRQMEIESLVWRVGVGPAVLDGKVDESKGEDSLLVM